MQKDRCNLIVANWIFIGVAMLIIQVLLGGITRLTGSGLSITEWRPIMGALPPMNESEWQIAFNRYQQIAQYKYLNQHYTLSNFKFIFFWEWFHRVWARLIGVVFLIPFIYFLVKGHFKKGMIIPLVILFLLGALQGAIGWLMVQSGLNDNDLYVSHIRLAWHFMAAMVLIGYALIFGLRLTINERSRINNKKHFHIAILITTLVVIQLVYGAFMAGLKAATAAPTWPDINGTFVPDEISRGSLFHNIFYDKITIHFIHRTLAYIIALCILTWWFSLRHINYSPAFNKVKNFTVINVVIQVVLGILTVLNSTATTSQGNFGAFEWFAQLHQLLGMLLLLNMVAALYMLHGKAVVSDKFA
jgi:cytochrome c oxidase assembly protein subunit 15